MYQMMLGNMDVFLQKNKIRPKSIILHKISYKWIRELTLKLETVKVLEENISSTL